MYVSTSHSIGETVYAYRADDDAVIRCTVREIRITQYMHATNVVYLLAHKTADGDGEFSASGDNLHTRPESAFYRNPLPANEAPATEAIEA